jgi:hypothetical protein
MILVLSQQIVVKYSISNFTKIRPMGTELYHVGRRAETDGRTDITKLMVAIRNFANERKNS